MIRIPEYLEKRRSDALPSGTQVPSGMPDGRSPAGGAVAPLEAGSAEDSPEAGS